jgi:nitrite reductase/ring-hydroxylating ferredoxin subunit
MAERATNLPTREPDESKGDPLWQQDFPINRGEELNNSRRQFLKFLGLTSLAFFTGTLGVAFKGVFEQQNTETLPELRVAALSDIPEGESRTFDYPEGGYSALLIHLPGGQFVAYEQRCTHLLCPVLYQKDKHRIFCPCHEGEFDPATGEREAGPPPRPLNKIKLEIRGNDIYAVGREG